MSTDVVDALRAHIAIDGAPSNVLVYTDSAVTIHVGAWSGGYSLWWTDHVVNQWVEWFPTLPVVMARVAALMHCIQTDTRFCGSDAFEVSAAEWFRELTSPGPQRLPTVVEPATAEAVPTADPEGVAMTADTVRCPTDPYQPDGTPHTIIGCGAMIPAITDDEGLVDCPQCGIWFGPLLESGQRTDSEEKDADMSTMGSRGSDEYDLDIRSSGIGWRSSMVLALQAAVADITREGPYAPVEITWDDTETQTATLHGFGSGDDIISFAGQSIELDRITRLRA